MDARLHYYTVVTPVSNSTSDEFATDVSVTSNSVVLYIPLSGVRPNSRFCVRCDSTLLFFFQILVPNFEPILSRQLVFEEVFCLFLVVGKHDGKYLTRRGRMAVKEAQIIAV